MATETTNLKLSKAESSDAIIQTLYANNNNLDIIDENISNLKTESDTKATKSELTALTEEVSDKADISYVDEEVTKLNTAISDKADISYVDSKEFTLPVATADTLGGIKVGANLAIDSDGTLRAVATSSGDSGDMLKSVYDIDNNGIVDNSEKLGGQLPSYYAKSSDLSAKQDKLTIDTTVTSGSTNPVTGGAVYNSIANQTQSASTITAGTFAGQVNANATAVANVGTAQVRNITASTTDLTAGTSALATGEIYYVYE